MKYYVNLFKRKKYVPLIVFFLWFLLGVTITCIYFIDVISKNIQLNNEFIFSPNFFLTLISSSNIGMLLIGIATCYFAMIIPTWLADAQDDSDYFVKRENDKIYIKYKSYEFLVDAETFDSNNLSFRDKNKKYVSMSKGYRIYNYVRTKCLDILEKKPDDSKTISKLDVINKFNDVRLATLGEKEEFAKSHKIYNKLRIFFVILSIILGISTIFWSMGIIGFMTTLKFELEYIFIDIILISLSAFLFLKSKKATVKNKILYNKIMNGELYIVKCTSFDKKNYSDEDKHHYKVKITDGNYVVDQWIELPENIYNQDSYQIYILKDYENEIYTA